MAHEKGEHPGERKDSKGKKGTECQIRGTVRQSGDQERTINS